MNNVQKFKQYLVESERLKKLGLTNPMDFDEAFEEFVDKWENDPKIQKAEQILRDRTQELFDKYIDLSNSDHDESYEERLNHWHYSATDEISLLEYILLDNQ